MHGQNHIKFKSQRCLHLVQLGTKCSQSLKSVRFQVNRRV